MSGRRTLVVTGGAGFIGSEIVRQLAAGGSPVVVIDNLVNGKREHLAGVPGRVTLLESGAEHRTQYVYDRQNGLLLATSQQQQVGSATAQMSVELQSRE